MLRLNAVCDARRLLYGVCVTDCFCLQVKALLGPTTEADLVKPEKKKKPAKPAAAPAASKGGDAAAEKKAESAEAWRTADPYAFLSKPEANNMVHTTIHFR